MESNAIPVRPEFNEHAEIVLRRVNKHKYKILLLTVVVLLIGIGIAYWLPFKHQSTVRFYSTNPKLSDPNVVFSENFKLELQSANDDDYRLMSMAYSNVVIDKMIERFHLYEHYGIDSTGPMHEERLIQQFTRNFVILKNEINAISLTVHDEDPYLAADIANAMAKELDLQNKQYIERHRKMLMDVYDSYYRNIEMAYLGKKDTVKQLQRDMMMLLPSNFRELDNYSIAGLSIGAQHDLINNQSALSSYANSVHFLEQELNHVSKLRSRARDAALVFNEPSLVVMSKALPEPKSHLLRILMVLLAGLATIVLSILYIAIHERNKSHLEMLSEIFLGKKKRGVKAKELVG